MRVGAGAWGWYGSRKGSEYTGSGGTGGSCRRILIWWCHASEQCSSHSLSLSLSFSLPFFSSLSLPLSSALAVVLACSLTLGVSMALSVVVVVAPKKMEKKKMDGMAPRDDKKSGLGCGVCLVIVVVVMVIAIVIVVVVVVATVVGACRGRQGGGHRVKTRKDPPSGARTLIDFPTSLVLPSVRRIVLAAESNTRPYSVLGCLLRPRSTIPALSLFARSDS